MPLGLDLGNQHPYCVLDGLLECVEIVLLLKRRSKGWAIECVGQAIPIDALNNGAFGRSINEGVQPDDIATLVSSGVRHSSTRNFIRP
jgi:hypothetical protein